MSFFSCRKVSCVYLLYFFAWVVLWNIFLGYWQMSNKLFFFHFSLQIYSSHHTSPVAGHLVCFGPATWPVFTVPLRADQKEWGSPGNVLKWPCGCSNSVSESFLKENRKKKTQSDKQQLTVWVSVGTSQHNLPTPQAEVCFSETRAGETRRAWLASTAQRNRGKHSAEELSDRSAGH